MKRFLFTVLMLWGVCLCAQIPAYYNDVNLTLTGQALKNELAQKITVTHTNILDYSDVWAVLQQTDLDPTNSANVLLVYGYNDSDGDITNDRTRNKNNNGGNVGEWNREHVYPKSLGQPDLGTSGPGADAHHLRSSDVQMNGNRSNRLFASGSGNAGPSGANWYPGDEWKGDVARMIMYMYLRYGNQCLPSNVGVGTAVVSDASMIDLFLQWNADDTVSVYETNRNNILETEQGNRNPFIDNPYLATIIWDGPVAMDKWDMTIGIDEYENKNYFTIYPNPVTESVSIQLVNKSKSDQEKVYLYSINGQLIKQYSVSQIKNNTLEIHDLKQGLYFVQYNSLQSSQTQKLIVQ